MLPLCQPGRVHRRPGHLAGCPAGRARRWPPPRTRPAWCAPPAANRIALVRHAAPAGAALRPRRPAPAYFAYAYDQGGRIVRVVREGGKQIYYAYDRADRICARAPGHPREASRHAV